MRDSNLSLRRRVSLALNPSLNKRTAAETLTARPGPLAADCVDAYDGVTMSLPPSLTRRAHDTVSSDAPRERPWEGGKERRRDRG